NGCFAGLGVNLSQQAIETIIDRGVVGAGLRSAGYALAHGRQIVVKLLPGDGRCVVDRVVKRVFLCLRSAVVRVEFLRQFGRCFRLARSEFAKISVLAGQIGLRRRLTPGHVVDLLAGGVQGVVVLARSFVGEITAFSATGR